MAGDTREQDFAERFPAVRRLEASTRARRIPEVRQLHATDCGAACLAMALGFHGRDVRLDEVREVMGIGRDGVSALGIIKPDLPGAFDWYRAWFAQLAACGVDAVTVDDIASPSGQALHEMVGRTPVLECLASSSRPPDSVRNTQAFQATQEPSSQVAHTCRCCARSGGFGCGGLLRAQRRQGFDACVGRDT